MRETALAVRLIELGARMQLLELELNISKEILTKLYHEVGGESPPKGMLPFTDEWFFTWQPCIHSSLFMSYYQFFKAEVELSHLELLIKAYEMYIQEVSRHRNYKERSPVLSITRVWIMLKKMKTKHPSLQMTTCQNCGGEYVTSAGLMLSFVCGFCHKPARAGKRNKV